MKIKEMVLLLLALLLALAILPQPIGASLDENTSTTIVSSTVLKYIIIEFDQDIDMGYVEPTGTNINDNGTLSLQSNFVFDINGYTSTPNGTLVGGPGGGVALTNPLAVSMSGGDGTITLDDNSLIQTLISDHPAGTSSSSATFSFASSWDDTWDGDGFNTYNTIVTFVGTAPT